MSKHARRSSRRRMGHRVTESQSRFAAIVPIRSMNVQARAAQFAKKNGPQSHGVTEPIRRHRPYQNDECPSTRGAVREEEWATESRSHRADSTPSTLTDR